MACEAITTPSIGSALGWTVLTRKARRATLGRREAPDGRYDGDSRRHRGRSGGAPRRGEAAERGEVELGVPPQGRLADLHGQYEGELAERVRRLVEKPGVVVLPQIARLSNVTFPSPTLFPGAYVDGFTEAWNAVAGSWHGPGKRPGAFDRWYAESHLLGGRDVLLTHDQGLGTMCARLSTEHGLPIKAESPAEYIARRG